MGNLRVFLIFALLTVGFLLFQQWQIDYGPRPTPPEPIPETAPPADLPQTPAVDDSLPAVPSAETSPQPTPVTEPEPEASEDTITVVTDVLAMTISTRGGDIIDARLLDYPVDLSRPDEVVQLFQRSGSGLYVAQSGLLSANGQAPDHRQLYRAERLDYHLDDGVDSLEIPLTWESEDGVRVTKRLTLRRGEYAIDVAFEVDNASAGPWQAAHYRQLQRTRPPEPEKGGFSNPERYSFNGAALYTQDEKYEKFDFDDIADEAVSRQSVKGWAAMVQHYFFAAWIPPAEEATTYSTRYLGQPGQAPRFLVQAVSPLVSVAPGAQTTLEATLYVGPKLQDTIDDLAEGLALTVDYGIFTPFSKVLYWLLAKIHLLVGNWGWAIVLLTVLVKAIFFKLTEAQYKSMAKMRKLQPRILSLKERYGDDRQKFNMAMMEIYKKEKVNPLGGCLPLLIQIPVFIALYWVLLESVELRQASFMLWIQDLSSPDPYFILPIINGAAMFMTTKLSPNPAADPIQQKIMLAMPLVFSVMFAFFQSGLVLYWAVNSVLSLAQQWVITKKIEREA